MSDSNEQEGQHTAGEVSAHSKHTQHSELTSASDDEWAAAEDRLYHWFDRARRNTYAHQAASKNNSALNIGLGIGIIIATSLAAYKNTQWVTYVTSGIVTGLVALQTFLKESEQAARHLAAADRYSLIRRKLEVIDATPRRSRASIKDTLERIATLLDEAATASPSVSDRIWKKAEKQADEQKASPVFINRRQTRKD